MIVINTTNGVVGVEGFLQPISGAGVDLAIIILQIC